MLALRQTGGRGRLGRSFFSPEGGIYLSLVLRPALSPEASLFITTAAAVAAAEAIEELFGSKTLIKWVNDIYIYNKKVCGILTEGSINTEGRLDFAILGIGINISEPTGGFPEDIADIAGAVCKNAVSLDKKARLVGLFCDRFLTYYNNIGEKTFLKEYRRRSLLTKKTVSFELNGTTHTGTVLGIDDNAKLLVETNGESFALGAGDVSVRWRA